MILTVNKPKSMAAVGLVEVLVVLAIVGVTMVASMQLTTDALRSIRDNQVADVALGFLVQGLEIAKNPQGVQLSSSFGQIVDVDGSYSLDDTTSPPTLFQLNNNITNPIQDCQAQYIVQYDQAIQGNKPEICLQIIIEEIAVGSYRIQTRVVYPTSDGPVVRSLEGVRLEEFIT